MRTFGIIIAFFLPLLLNAQSVVGTWTLPMDYNGVETLILKSDNSVVSKSSVNYKEAEGSMSYSVTYEITMTGTWELYDSELYINIDKSTIKADSKNLKLQGVDAYTKAYIEDMIQQNLNYLAETTYNNTSETTRFTIRTLTTNKMILIDEYGGKVTYSKKK